MTLPLAAMEEKKPLQLPETKLESHAAALVKPHGAQEMDEHVELSLI